MYFNALNFTKTITYGLCLWLISLSSFARSVAYLSIDDIFKVHSSKNIVIGESNNARYLFKLDISNLGDPLIEINIYASSLPVQISQNVLGDTAQVDLALDYFRKRHKTLKIDKTRTFPPNSILQVEIVKLAGHENLFKFNYEIELISEYALHNINGTEIGIVLPHQIRLKSQGGILSNEIIYKTVFSDPSNKIMNTLELSVEQLK